MRISFDFNKVDPEAVASILKEFYDYSREDNVELGPINLYVTVRRKENGSSVVYLDKEDREIVWVVKSRQMKKTKKPLLVALKDEGLFVYKGKGKQYYMDD